MSVCQAREHEKAASVDVLGVRKVAQDFVVAGRHDPAGIVEHEYRECLNTGIGRRVAGDVVQCRVGLRSRDCPESQDAKG